MDFWKEWSFWLSLVTFFAAIVAIVISIEQIKNSNKQHLFDRRLRVYLIVMELIESCKNNVTRLTPKDNGGIFWENEILFVWLTNNTFMEEQANAIRHPLEQPHHRSFLRKREEIRNIAVEISIIFHFSEACDYANFLNAYEQALFAMYQYQIIINDIKAYNEKQPTSEETLQKNFSEPENREKMFLALNKLKDALDHVMQPQIEQRIKKQLVIK